jgi:hypothetical protein
MRSEFEESLREVINRYSKENASNTPDFILAQYLNSCLDAFNQTVQQRETWYGRDPRPSEIFPQE